MLCILSSSFHPPPSSTRPSQGATHNLGWVWTLSWNQAPVPLFPRDGTWSQDQSHCDAFDWLTTTPAKFPIRFKQGGPPSVFAFLKRKNPGGLVGAPTGAETNSHSNQPQRSNRWEIISGHKDLLKYQFRLFAIPSLPNLFACYVKCSIACTSSSKLLVNPSRNFSSSILSRPFISNCTSLHYYEDRLKKVQFTIFFNRWFICLKRLFMFYFGCLMWECMFAQSRPYCVNDGSVRVWDKINLPEYTGGKIQFQTTKSTYLENAHFG